MNTTVVTTDTLVLTESSPDVGSILDTVTRRLADRQLPEATYRLQFNHSFTFRGARQVVPYLASMGITDCYASPYLKATAGSTHGYDIVDHTTLNGEIGGEDDHNAFVSTLHEHGMGLIADVVPNHMGVASNDNVWWMDVLENGPGSPYASFFDIDWMPLKPDLANKVLLPVLGDQFGKVLEDQQLVLAFEDGAFWVNYHDRRFPIAPHPAAMILRHRIEELERRLGSDNPYFHEYQSVLTAIGHLPPREETDPQRVCERRREKEILKRRINELCRAAPEANAFIEANVRVFNGVKGDRRSFDLLDQLLQNQAYRLAYWQVAADEINYRRFFDINELAAICMENQEVFQKAHALIFRLLAEGKLNGLRIDHADGLYNPTEYLWQLQRTRFMQLCQAAGQTAGLGRDSRDTGSEPPMADTQSSAAPSTDSVEDTESPWDRTERVLNDRYEEIHHKDPAAPIVQPLYVVVEKILERGERLPENWPTYGTTGYEFLNAVNGLFVDRANAKAFDAIYSRFVRERVDFRDVVYDCKKLIMQSSMSSELSVLGHQLDRISERVRWSRDFTLNSLTEVLREVIACFPVYRTYISESGVLEPDRRYVESAVARAKRRNPATSSSIFDFVRDILLLKYAEEADTATRAAQRTFVGRFQQMTGPVMAKACEDTAFYRFNRLASLNEVGGDPEKFGGTVAGFHQQNQDHLNRWPHSLLATTTHDTKRGEDVRARINVLSEMPKLWKSHLLRWSRSNQRKKADLDGELVPSRNDEYLLYQTLIGVWPFQPIADSERPQFVNRIQQYMLKAVREAKVHTSWISPNESYEQALSSFVAGILDRSSRNAFLTDFEPFALDVAQYGIWNSLSQTLLKITSPGVPDFYQGTELWDLSLVDPDNRRIVDYALRRDLLQSIQTRIEVPGCNLTEFSEELIFQRADGRIKLFVISQVLNYRRVHPGLFTTGAYFALDSSGNKKDNLCAFVRQASGTTVLVAAPRLVVQLTSGSPQPPLGTTTWGDTSLHLPDTLAAARFRNLFTGDILEPESRRCTPQLPAAQVFRAFPVALLERL